MTIRDTIHESVDHRATADSPDFVAALADDALRVRGHALVDDISAHLKLRRIAAMLPPAAQVYQDVRLLAAASEAVAIADPALYLVFLSHYILCVGSIADLADGAVDGEQALAHADAKGVFMVTELGDASSHLGIRTQATYDPDTRRFVLHTPDARASKFSGVAAAGLPQKAAVCARLFAADRDHGVFSFLVDITGDDGKPCQGVHLSAPMELDAVPLPYCMVRFERVSIPFDRWLSDGARLTDGGHVHDPLGNPDARLQRTLSCGQALWATLPSAFAGMSARAAAIAWRYNSGRRSHGRLAPDSPVLVYRPQQHAIIGGLATAFALRCEAESALAARKLIRGHDGRGGALNDPNPGTMTFAPWAAVDRSLALYKAHTAQTTARLIDELQHRCGLSGFLALNRMSGYLGFARGFDNAGGDNALIYMDVGRALAGESGDDESAPHLTAPADPTAARWWPATIAALQHQLTTRLRAQLTQRTANHAADLDLWNPLLDEARLLGTVHALRLAADAVTENAPRLWPTLDPRVADALAALNGVLEARRIAGHLLAHEVLDPTTVLNLPAAADDLCDRLAPHLSVLADLLDTGAKFAPAPMAEHDYATALETALGFTPAATAGNPR